MARYFTYRYSGSSQIRGYHTHELYWFQNGVVTPVADNEDAEYFLHLGSPETGIYPYRETDASGRPIGPFPPIDLKLRTTMIDPKTFPSDKGVPSAKVWKEVTEDMADPTLYYHFIRKRIRG